MLLRHPFVITVSVILCLFSINQTYGQKHGSGHSKNSGATVVVKPPSTSDPVSIVHSNSPVDATQGQRTVYGFNPVSNKPTDSSQGYGTVYGFNPVANKPTDSSQGYGTGYGFNPVVSKPTDFNQGYGSVYGFNPVASKPTDSNQGYGSVYGFNLVTGNRQGYGQNQRVDGVFSQNSYVFDGSNRKPNTLDYGKQKSFYDTDSYRGSSVDVNRPIRPDSVNKYETLRPEASNFLEQLSPSDRYAQNYRSSYGKPSNYRFVGDSDEMKGRYPGGYKLGYSSYEQPKRFSHEEYKPHYRRYRRSDGVDSSGQSDFYAKQWNV